MANCYFDRQNNGFFTQLEEQLRAIEPTSTFALGTMSYGCEFHSAYFPPEKEGGFGRTQFYLGGNKDERGDELGLIFFGKVCHSAYGTQISAKGNHSVGRTPKVCLLTILLLNDIIANLAISLSQMRPL
jgi:hypothetical protein